MQCLADQGDKHGEAGGWLQQGLLWANEISYFGSGLFDFAAAENV
jgi:hypothetical protein